MISILVGQVESEFPFGDSLFVYLSIAAFFLRLVCTNGLISTTEVKASYKHVCLKIFKEFPKDQREKDFVFEGSKLFQVQYLMIDLFS
jgi:hypothetical protein